MDGFELGMGDRGADRRWQIVALHEPAKIAEQHLDVVGGWWNEVSVRRIVSRSNPVLGRSDLAAFDEWNSRHQNLVDLADVVDGQRSGWLPSSMA